MRDIFIDTGPRRVVVEEEYFLEQEISEHRRTGWSVTAKPQGRIEWQVLYDGANSRRIARSSAARRRLLRHQDPAIVGRLAVTDHDGTDLATTVPFGADHDTVALTLPTRPAEFPDGEHLATGRHEARGSITHHPWGAGEQARPAVLPLSCEIGIGALCGLPP